MWTYSTTHETSVKEQILSIASFSFSPFRMWFSLFYFSPFTNLISRGFSNWIGACFAWTPSPTFKPTWLCSVNVINRFLSLSPHRGRLLSEHISKMKQLGAFLIVQAEVAFRPTWGDPWTGPFRDRIIFVRNGVQDRHACFILSSSDKNQRCLKVSHLQSPLLTSHTWEIQINCAVARSRKTHKRAWKHLWRDQNM